MMITVIDGDTIRNGPERIRIENIDAPELHGKCEAEIRLANAAKQQLAVILMTTPEIIRHGKDRYGRTLALLRVHGADVGEMLIVAHLARRWDGRRHPWC